MTNCTPPSIEERPSKFRAGCPSHIIFDEPHRVAATADNGLIVALIKERIR